MAAPLLEIQALDVYYGRAHALQGVSLQLDRGVLGIVGRNGMGKTTLCNAITGLVPARGSVRLLGEEVLGLAPNEITKRGIAYVPQGRRVWPSLSVDETLRLGNSETESFALAFSGRWNADCTEQSAGGVKGRRPSKKDKLRAAAAAAAAANQDQRGGS